MNQRVSVRYLGENYEYQTIQRVVRNVVLARYDWLGRFGLKVGEVVVDGEKVLVAKYPQQKKWWIWDIGDSDPR